MVALCWEADPNNEVDVRASSLRRQMPVWHDAANKRNYLRVGTLHVCYTTGDVYRYYQISEADYVTIRCATSVGKAVNALLKPSRRAAYVHKLSKQAMEQLNK